MVSSTCISSTLLHVFRLHCFHLHGTSHRYRNYRGISVMPALTKVYDIIHASRFIQWYKPPIEQAGAGKGQGCGEQVLTVRLLIDFA